ALRRPGQRQHVDEAGHRSDQRAQDPADQGVPGDDLPVGVAPAETVDQVADEREDPQPDRNCDEHGMNRVSCDVCRCTHKASFTLSSKIRASFAGAALGAAAMLCGCASRESVAQAEPAKSFPREQIAKGEELAHIGNCLSCHTAEGGKPYAGGTPLKTPFGTIYGTNITPDPETGVGRWSPEAFSRAMREGVDREGRHLFPAFPYDHFTKLTDEDIAALYAFVMTREPVRQENRRHSVPLPRASVGIWKSRYFERGVFKPDPSRSAEWNRGAYLVEGLGHCGACHTPRNKLGAEVKDHAFTGGE